MSKVVIITGCSSGIGFATALEFARHDYVVYATMRDLSKKASLQEIAKSQNLSLRILALDVTDQNSIDEVISKIETEEGRIDLLINNAGYGLFGSLEDTSIEEMKEQFETDYFGAVRMIKKVLPLMRKTHSGKIINLSSLVGLVGFPFCSSYVATKFALEGLVESLRFELRKLGIQLSLIEPGVVKTNFYQNRKIAKNTTPTSVYNEWMNNFTKIGDSMFKKNATPPEVVGKKILEIAQENIMKPRYMIGQEVEQLLTQKQILTPLEYEKFIEEFMLKSIF